MPGRRMISAPAKPRTAADQRLPCEASRRIRIAAAEAKIGRVVMMAAMLPSDSSVIAVKIR